MNFIYDFGRWNRSLWNRALCNPVDLVDRKEMESILRYCLSDVMIESLSDYELFEAFCQARPLLSGHAYVAKCEHLLQACFDLSLPLAADCCEEVWRTVATKCLEHPITLWDCVLQQGGPLPIRCLSASVEELQDLPKEAIPVLHANVFCSLRPDSWTDWKQEMDAILDAYAKRGCDSVYYVLPETYRHQNPNLYLVERALIGEEKRDDIVVAQVFRFLCEVCISRNWTLLLRMNSTESNTLRLLEFAEQTVGLPKIVWTTSDPILRAALLSGSAKGRTTNMICGMTLSDYPSDVELWGAISSYAARYPYGRLAVLSDCDLRFLPYEHERFIALSEAL